MGNKPTYEELIQQIKKLDHQVAFYKHTSQELQHKSKGAATDFPNFLEGFKIQFHKVPMPAYIWRAEDNDFTLIDFNPAAKEITNGSVTGLIGITATEMYADQPEILSDLSRCFTNKTAIQHEMNYRFKSTGETTRLEVTYLFLPPDLILTCTQDLMQRGRSTGELDKIEEAKQALRNIPNVLCLLIDAEGTVHALNEIAAWRLGKRMSDLSGKIIYDFLPAALSQSRKKWVDRVFRFKSPVHFEDEQTGRTYDNCMYPVFDYRGIVQQVVVFARDTTEQNQTARALQESDNKYRATIESAPYGIIVHDRNGKILLSNRQMAEITGYTADEISDISSWLLKAYPDEQYRQKVIEARKTITPSGRPRVREAIITRKNGQKRTCEFSSIAYPSGLRTVFVKDISEQKRIEETLRKYERIVAGSKDHMALIDKNYIYQAVNEAYVRSFGISRQEIVGRSVAEIIGRELFENKIKAKIDQCLTGRAVHFQIWIDFPVAGQRYMDIVYHPFVDTDRSISAIVVNSRDITRTKQLESHLWQAQKLDAIATLAGGIAHEFNNALVGITGNIELLEMDKPGDENLRNYIQSMKISAHRMLTLTKQLLAYARGGKYKSQPTSLSAFIDETLPLLKHTIPEYIRVEADLADDLTPVEADVTQMQAVLSSILSNAIEAIEKNGHIKIATRNQDLDTAFLESHPGLEPGRYACLIVEDNGSGMNEETKSRIFEPFFTTKFQGRGLSMAAVYGIINNHGGWLDVESEPDKGTSVKIYLPSAHRQAKDINLRKSAATESRGTILLIEDEKVVRNVGRQMLERMDYLVLEAKTGGEAVEITKKFRGNIDAVILDMKLPDIDGLQVYKKLMALRSDLKVLVVSGFSIDGPVKELLNAGAQDFIQKPFTFSSIYEKLDNLLKKKSY